MKQLLKCRRSVIALIAIGALTFLGWELKSADVAMAIATVAIGIAGANSAEAVFAKKKGVSDDQP